MDILLAPFKLIWKLVAGILEITGRLVAGIIGFVLLVGRRCDQRDRHRRVHRCADCDFRWTVDRAGIVQIGPTLRRLTINDYDAIIALWQRSGLTSIRPTGRDSREAFAKQIVGGQIAIGLEEADRLIGVVIATHDTRKGWINRLAIDPDYRRRRVCATAGAICRRCAARSGPDVDRGDD